MDEKIAIDLIQEAVWRVLLAGGPLVGMALLMGLSTGIFQAVTSIKDQTLAFASKIIAVLFSLIIFGPWILSTIVTFTKDLYNNINIYLG